MSDNATPPKYSLKLRMLGYGLTFGPPFLLYKIAGSMARGAGHDGFAAVGFASLGALAGALLAGVAIYFVFGRKQEPKA